MISVVDNDHRRKRCRREPVPVLVLKVQPSAQKADFCLSLRQLKITGKDLQAFGFQGKAIGETLNKLLDAVLCGQLPNDREVLLLHLERYTQKHK